MRPISTSQRLARIGLASLRVSAPANIDHHCQSEWDRAMPRLSVTVENDTRPASMRAP